MPSVPAMCGVTGSAGLGLYTLPSSLHSSAKTLAEPVPPVDSQPIGVLWARPTGRRSFVVNCRFELAGH
jgi:hypothetical protein